MKPTAQEIILREARKAMGDDAPNPDLMTINEAAEHLRISRRSVQNLMYSREIGFLRFGANIRFTTADINAFIESSRQAPTNKTKP